MFFFIAKVEKEKKNEIKVWAECRKCNRSSLLSCYDVRRARALYGFLPTEKGQQFHISRRCRFCRTSFESELSSWESDFKFKLDEALDHYKENKSNLKYASNLFDILIYYDAGDAIEDTVAEVINDFPDNNEFWSLLGDLYRYFVIPEKAHSAFTKSLEISFDESVKKKLIQFYLEQGEGESVEKEVMELVKADEEQSVSMIYQLAEGYRAQGLHSDVLRILDFAKEEISDIKKDLTFRRLYSESRKNIKSNKPLRCNLLAKEVKQSEESNLKVILIVTALVFSFITIASYFNKPKVYLAGGININYAINIEGKKYIVPKQFHVQKLDLDYGVYELKSQESDIPDLQINIDIPFFLRLITNKTYVINPDSQGKFIVDTAVYSVNDPDEEVGSKVFEDKAFYIFENIDYPFEDFPDTIKVKGNETIYKKRLTFLKYN